MVVICEALTKSYTPLTPALRPLSFALPTAACLGIIGANGAGKTTLLKCLLNWTQPSTGVARIFGYDSQLPQARTRLACVPEKFTPPAYCTGAEYLQIAAALYDQVWQEHETRSMLRALELEPAALTKKISTYSKGMAQKLGLAAVFLSQRELLILDEPMSGLDPVARHALRQQLQAYQQRGHTLLFTSHDLHDVSQLCSHILILHQGQKLFFGSLPAFQAMAGTDDLERALLDVLRHARWIPQHT